MPLVFPDQAAQAATRPASDAAQAAAQGVTPRPQQPAQPAGRLVFPRELSLRDAGSIAADMGTALWEGAKSTGRMLGATGNTVGGNLSGVDELARSQAAAEAQSPDAKALLMQEIQRRKAANPDAGWLDVIKSVGASFIGQPEGAAQFVAEQTPNTVVSLGAGIAGAKGGAALGSLIMPGVGTAVGGVAGFLGGMFLGNASLEIGGKAMEKSQDQARTGGSLTADDASAAIREGSVKSGVITAVDAATLGAGRGVARLLNKSAIEAGARAEARVLADAGVDVTSRTAIERSLAADPVLRATAQEAGKVAAQSASKVGNRAATGGTLLGMETVGEGAGEYLGELAATGKADKYDAVMEAIAGFSQSVPETAWNMRQSQGNDLSARGIERAGNEPAAPGQTPAPAPGQPPAPLPPPAPAAPAGTIVPPAGGPGAPGAPGAVVPPLDPANIPPDLDAQNRDRTRSASVLQMQKIAQNPDYLRAGPSRSPDTGAPMVFAQGDDTSLFPSFTRGREDVAVMSDGQRVPFQYAVVDASLLQPSNFADGTPNPLFNNETPGLVKALSNARSAGLRAAWAQGTASGYAADFEADTEQHGISVEAIRSTSNPVLVRLYSQSSNTPGMAARSQGQGLGMSPGELARQDAPLIDGGLLAVWQGGDVADARNLDFVRGFVGRLQGTGQDLAGMMTQSGTLSPDGRKRIQAALAQSAYGDSDLIAEMFDSTDTDIKAIGEALKLAAPEWADMRDSARTGAIDPAADITPALLDAVAMVRRARQQRQSLSDLARQTDITTGQTPDPMVLGALRLLYGGEYLTRPMGRDRMADFLREYTRLAKGITADAGLFGDAPAPLDVLTALTKETATDGQQQQPGAAAGTNQQPGPGLQQPNGGSNPRGNAGAGGAAAVRPGDNAGGAQPAAGGAGPLANTDTAGQAAAQVAKAETTLSAQEEDRRKNLIRTTMAQKFQRLAFDHFGDGKITVSGTLSGADALELSLTDAERKLLKRADWLFELAETPEERNEASAARETALRPAVERLLGPPAPDYEARLQDRRQRIAQAKTPDEAQTVLQEEYQDNERHFEGTTGLEKAARNRAKELADEVANREREADNRRRLDAGEWVEDDTLTQLYRATLRRGSTQANAENRKRFDDAMAAARAANPDREYEAITDRGMSQDMDREVVRFRNKPATTPAPRTPEAMGDALRRRIQGDVQAKRDGEAAYQSGADRIPPESMTAPSQRRMWLEGYDTAAPASANNTPDDDLDAMFNDVLQQELQGRSQAPQSEDKPIDWEKASTPDIEAEVNRLQQQSTSLLKKIRAVQDISGDERESMIQDMDALDNRRSRLENILGRRERDSKEEEEVVEPAANPLPDWTSAVEFPEGTEFKWEDGAGGPDLVVSLDGKEVARSGPAQAKSGTSFHTLRMKKALLDAALRRSGQSTDLNWKPEGGDTSAQDARDRKERKAEQRAQASSALTAAIDKADKAGADGVKSKLVGLRMAMDRKDKSPGQVLYALKTVDADITKELGKAGTDEPRTAGQAAASAAQNVGQGLTNAIDGLGALFGGKTPGRLGSGPTFDEETYAKAKPLFQAALSNFKDAASDIKEAMRAVVRMVLDKFGEDAARNMQPYVVRYIRDVRDGAQTTTPGTRLSWSNVSQWIGAYRELQRRAPAANKYRQIEAHIAALTDAKIDEEKDPQALRDLRDLFESDPQLKPSRGNREGSEYVRILDAVDRGLKRLSGPTKQERLDMGADPVESLMSRMRRYASGLSAVGDLGAGGRAAGGARQRGIGVDVGELSKNGIETLANAIVNQGAAAFIDSGAFGAFRRGLKSGAVTPLDFDALLDKYNSILDAISAANPAEMKPGADYPVPLMVMPDIVGDQAGSIELVRQYKRWISTEASGNLMRPIVPIQVGELTMAEAYAQVVEILGTDNFIVGVPSNERAVSNDEFTAFLRDAKPKAVHILGAASDRTLQPRLRSIVQAGMAETLEVTADASPIRSAILRAVQQGSTRGEAIEDFLLEPDDGPKPGLNTPAGRMALAQIIADRFIGGDGFKTIIEARKFIADAAGEKIEAGTQAAKLADEAIEMAVVLAGREIVQAARAQGRSDSVIYDRLVNLYDLQPTLGVRTSTSVREQAYSTPVPLAFLASRRAQVGPDSTVGEPTAGNTMLLIEVDPERAAVNELNADRAANARALGFTVTSHDAARHQLAPEKSLDRVVANPPFGAVKGDDGETVVFPVASNYGTREIDHAISFKALDALKDDGSAVLILGGVEASNEEAIREGYRSKSKREFYFRLYGLYNVVDHFTVDGGLYSKQGAGYPVDVVVIRGRGKATRAMPAAELPKRYDNWEALKKEKLDGSTEATATGVVPTGPATGTGRSDGAQGQQPGAGGLVDGAGRQGAGTGGQGTRPGRGGDVGGTVAGTPGAEGQPGRRGGAGAAQPGTADGPDAGRDGAAQTPVPGQGPRGVRGNAPGDGGNRPGDVGGTGGSQGQRVESGLSDRRGQEQETETQVEYAPQSGAASVGTLVPRAMRESIAASLKRVADSVGNIDEFVAEKLNFDPETLRANFSAEQVDALALAIMSAEAGKGFIIGDQTGIGKGRVVAAMLRYAMINERIPVFVTEKPNLYADMIRDLDDIGMGDELRLQSNKPLILATNSSEPIPYVLQRKSGDTIVETEHTLRAPGAGADLEKLFDKIAGSRDIGSYKIVFTTYSQLQTVKGKVTARMRMVQSLAQGGYMVFDESHNAGGTQITQPRTKKDRDAAKAGETTTGRSGFVRSLVRASSGSFFSSATYAKRPDVMDLYSSTNMLLAVDRPADLAPAIMQGGVPMQQIVATMLADDGQYIRRERTFAGVTYETRPMTVDRQTAENMAQSMRMILAFSRGKEAAVKAMQKEFDREGAMVGVSGGEKTSVQGANFGAIMHNLIDQMLLSLKAKESVDFAIERLKAGEKVVLTVANTMGSFLSDYAEEFGIRPGEPVTLSFADLYQRYLEKQRVVKIKRPGGPKSGVPYRLTDSDLGSGLVAQYNDVARFIQEAGFGSAPISPIDYMHQRLREAGYKTDEITGRSVTVSYAGKAPVLASRNANIKQRLTAIRGFNSGAIDVIILNQSGATGLSLHASAKVKDQRKRRMIIVQAEKNIDTHMQMLGRVHRTGQVITPDYTQAMADIPAEARPASVLLKKMASLNANTTASRKSAVTAEGVVDFMNNYGGQVAAEFLLDNPEIHMDLGGQKVLEIPAEATEADEDLIRKLTGYIPILPIEQQEAVYRDLVDRYNDLLARENAMGTNKLEAAALDLGAKTEKREQITTKRDSPVPSRFAEPAFMEQVDVARTVKPLTKAEVQEAVSQSLGGKTPQMVANELNSSLAQRMEPFLVDLQKRRMQQGADTDGEKRAQLAQEVERHRMQQSIISDLLFRFQIGQEVSLLDEHQSVTYGVITSVSAAGKTKSPAAASGWKFTIALANGEARSITLSASQIGKQFTLRAERGPVLTLNPSTNEPASIRIPDLFDAYGGSGNVRREKRWMVTGNLLAGFASYPGQILTYTKDDGSTGQGVLMRRGFDFEKRKGEAKASFPSATVIRLFFTEAGRNATIGTPDGVLRVKWYGGNYPAEFEVASSKREGGRFYLDRGLTDALGRDFTKVGQVMRAAVTEDDMMRALVYLMTERDDVKLEAQTNKDVARRLLGLPDVTDSQSKRTAREEGAVYRVRERDDERDIPSDLFPDTLEYLEPLASDPRVHRKRRNPGGVPVAAPESKPTAVLAVRQDPAMPGVYHHSSQLVQVGMRDLPVSKVTNWQEASSALSALGKFAVEHFDALVTDAAGKPLAVIGAFKGAQAEASVYPQVVLAEALRIEGAARVWGVHNHPSGNQELSIADRRLSESLRGAFDPSSVQWMGIAAIGEGRFQAYDGRSVSEGALLEGKTAAVVPIVERTIQRMNVGMPVLSTTAEAKRVVGAWSNNKPGLLFVSNSNQVTAWVPTKPAEMKELRKGGRFDRLMNSASEAGAKGVLISNPKGMMDTNTLNNIAAALRKLDVNVLDVIDSSADKTAAETGVLPSRSGPVFSRTGADTKGMTVAGVQRVSGGAMSAWANKPRLVVARNIQDPSVPQALRDEDARQRKGGATGDVRGTFYEGVIYLFSDHLGSDKDVIETLFHEGLGHYGLRGVFGDALNAVLDMINLARPDLMRPKAAEYGADLRKPAQRRKVAEEVLASMAQSEPSLGFVRRAVAAVRTWLRTNVPGFEKLRLTDAEIIRSFILPARQFVMRDQAQAVAGRDMAATNPDIRFSRGAFFDVNRMSAEQVQAEIRALMPRVNEAYEAGNLALAERLDARLETLMDALESNFVELEEDQLTTLDLLNPMMASKKSDGEMGDAEADVVRDLANTWKEMNDGRFGFANMSPSEKSDALRGILSDYAWRHGGLKPGLTDKQILDGAEDAFKAVYGMRSAQFARARDGVDRSAVRPASMPMFSRQPAGPRQTPAQRAETILATSVTQARPLDRVFRTVSRMTGLEAVTNRVYGRAAYLLDRFTPETVKAGIVSDYGVPEAVIDMRVMLQGRQRQQLRRSGELVDKLASLTREESRIAYEWMNMDGSDPRAYLSMMQGLPEESVRVLQDVQRMIDDLSKEAVRLGQLDPRSYERFKFAYLRRTYERYLEELTPQQRASQQRATRILGDQYRMRGLVEPVEMAKIKSGDPEWWGRKEREGKGDTGLVNQKFIKLERLKPTGAGTIPLPGMTGRPDGKVLEVVYWPADRAVPAKYSEWRQNEVFEVRDVKGGKVILWRDFTKDEREAMGEVDEARFAIARTLQRMVHDVEVGRYLEGLSQKYAKADGDEIDGTLVEASEHWHRAFKPGDWVKVPETKITGTSVAKSGKLAGKYLPGPIWNDVRFAVNGPFQPFGEVYGKVLSAWKVAKTALTPAVHMNNVMANLVMADWHEVGAAHVGKALRIILAANQRAGKGALGSLGNVAASGGIADREAALQIMNRYRDAGGDIGSWATQEIAREQMAPLLDAVLEELGRSGDASVQGQIGVMAALQHLLHLKLPEAWSAFKASKPATVAGREAQSMIDLYQAEDDVFRLAAWLAAKERGLDDLRAGREARKSFLDYDINAPWIDAMRRSAWPFIAFTYRAVPMLFEIAGKRPHKLMKLAMLVGALNMLGVAMSGDDEDEDERRRRMLPEEKAGKVWGIVPKLIRMPWDDKNGSPVYLDIRRFVPVGDIVDTGSTQAALPVPPGLMPGGPLVILGEVLMNKSAFTGKAIVLETDTPTEVASKVFSHLYKGFVPNLPGLPGTYATDALVNAGSGKTDAFGRQQSVAQAVASSVGVKLGSYPEDVLRRNTMGRARADEREIETVMRGLQRQRQMNAISQEEFDRKIEVQREKLRKLSQETREKVAQ